MQSLTSTQKRVFIILILIGLIYLSLFAFPNNTGAKDPMMISLFEPDEFAQYTVVANMLTPRETLSKTIVNFLAYRQYYYGSTFYVTSALLVLPIKLAQNFSNTQLIMLLLREAISVLPMLGALLLLTYSQTKFKSYFRTIFIFVFLLSITAVVENDLWWHPDSIAIFFVALTFFFLDRDNLRFGLNFFLTAASVGLATGTKVIGLFFFLTIPTYLIAGLIGKRLTWRNLFLRAAAFVGIMVAMIFISNPFLFLPSQFSRTIFIMSQQSIAMSSGWTVAYAKGPLSWWPILRNLYGPLILIALAFIALGFGIWRGQNRILPLLILAWIVPFSLYILYVVAIKPTHFFLPIVLPLYSSLVVLFEFPPFTPRENASHAQKWSGWMLGAIVLAVLGYQFFVFIQKDINLYQGVLTREQGNQALAFYSTVENQVLPRIQSDKQLVVYRDVRMYFPNKSGWHVLTFWNSSYSMLTSVNPDVLILWRQRIYDYTQQGAQENALDPVSFQDMYQFYMDASQDKLKGYHLVYQNSIGLMFVSNTLYQNFFQ